MNLIASLRDRLNNQAREQGIAYASFLEQFALSRFLARLEKSDYADRFILKGAQLFRFISVNGHRPTKDADFLSYGEHDPATLKQIFTNICQITPPEEDALIWEDIRAASIRDENSYGGVRVLITGKLGKTRIPLQFDIGFGDVITPEVCHQKWSSPLDYPDVPLVTYPLETVIAEKLEAAISLGINNSRMKDFYDLHWLQSHLNFDGNILTEAITNTFTRRATEIPRVQPIAFTTEFSSDEEKLVQWAAFIRKGKLPPNELADIVKDISIFLQPVLSQNVFGHLWTPTAHWQTRTQSP